MTAGSTSYPSSRLGSQRTSGTYLMFRWLDGGNQDRETKPIEHGQVDANLFLQ